MSQAKVLTEEEFKRVLTVLKGESSKLAKRNRMIVLLSFYAGMRVCEICHLKVSDLTNPDLTIKDRINLKPLQTKGSKGRTVFINQKLRKELCDFIRSEDISHDKHLIQSQKGGAFLPNTLVTLFREIYNKAGLKDARSHSGRRTFITKLANKGVSARVIQTLAGHSSLQTTQRYIDVNEEMLINAVELL